MTAGARGGNAAGGLKEKEPRLLYLSPVFWRSYPQRSHFFARFFLERCRGRVLWVDPYLTRLPSPGDLRLSMALHDQGTPPPPGLEVLSVPAVPLEPLPGGTAINRALYWRAAWRRMARFAAEGSTVAGVGKPSRLALDVLERLPLAGAFYDAMDDFPAFHRGLSRSSAARAEAAIAERVDVVYASSSYLAERWSRRHARVRHISNACDPSALPEPSPPPRTPVRLGYVGSMARWFDWKLVGALAAALPEAELLLVGPLFTRPPRGLPRNVFLHPPCDPAGAAAWHARFTAGLIPFVKSDLTRGVDPIKYYEYRACGRPVLTTRFGEMANRGTADGVFFLDGGRSPAGAVEEALAFPFDAEAAHRFRAEHGWRKRLEQCNAFGPPLFGEGALPGA